MAEYRKNVPLNHHTEYTWVELGPIPGLPPWHEQSKPASYPFPNEAAAVRFAHNHKASCPDRDVSVVMDNGSKYSIG